MYYVQKINHTFSQNVIIPKQFCINKKAEKVKISIDDFSNFKCTLSFYDKCDALIEERSIDLIVTLFLSYDKQLESIDFEKMNKIRISKTIISQIINILDSHFILHAVKTRLSGRGYKAHQRS